MWRRIEARLALLELLLEGKLIQRQGQTEAHRWLAELPWTRATRRRGEIALVPERTTDLTALLDRVWPDWRDVHQNLRAAGLPPTPAGWQTLEDRRRGRALPALPARLNRHTAVALAGPHAKVSLTAERGSALSGVEVVDDGQVRLRVPAGMSASSKVGDLDLAPLVALLGEVAIPERAFRDGLSLAGPVRAVLLVENLGVWRDMPQPEGWLLAWVPGWDASMVPLLLAALPRAPVVHFGDLDPNGVRIHRHLATLAPDLGWLVPEFWREWIEGEAQETAWPLDLNLADAPLLVRDLAARGLWLEQEKIVLDGRLVGEMERLLPA